MNSPARSTTTEIRKSICTICDPLSQCGVDLHISNEKIIKVEGTKENPHSAGTLCSKGAALRQYVYRPNRIRTPLKRSGPRGCGSFKAISWEEALTTVAENLLTAKKKYGPESTAFYVGYPKYMRPFVHRLTHAFGSPNYLTESSTCAQAMFMAQKLTFGIPAGPDMMNTRCLLVWSVNPFHSNTCMARLLLTAKDNGLPFIVVDPRRSPTARCADIHLQLKPGTDGALALSLAHVIIEENLVDHDFISNHTYGFEEYRKYVTAFTPERTERITAVPAIKIREAARLYATSKPAAIMPSASSVVHHTNGVQNYRAVFLLAALTGNYDIRGGNFAQPPSYLYVPAGIPTRFAEFVQPKKWESMAPRIGKDKFPVWTQLVDEGQAMHLPTQIRSGNPYRLSALTAFGLNHRMWPDPASMARSLKKLDFIAVADITMTDSCNLADIVLPACTSVERSEFRCYPERYAIYTQPAVKPLFESRPDADIVYDLARHLRIRDPLFKAGYEASLDWILEPSGLTIKELKKHPAGLFIPRTINIPERKYLNNSLPTPSGKVEFKSQVLEKYRTRKGYDPLPVYRPPKYSAESRPDMARKFPFILNTGSRLPMFIHSQTFSMSWTRRLRPEPAADINPQDGLRLAIAQGDTIRLSTKKGSITVKANLTALVQTGVVHMYHGYPEADVNTLIEASYQDPISGYPGFKSLLCNIEKVKEG